MELESELTSSVKFKKWCVDENINQTTYTPKKHISPTLQQLQNTPKHLSVRVKRENLNEKYAALKCTSTHVRKETSQSKRILGVSVWPGLNDINGTHWHVLFTVCLCEAVLILILSWHLYGWVVFAAFKSLRMITEADCLHTSERVNSLDLYRCHYIVQNMVDRIHAMFHSPDTSGSHVARHVFTPIFYLLILFVFMYVTDDMMTYGRRVIPRIVRMRCYKVTLVCSVASCSLLLLSALLLVEHRLQSIVSTLIGWSKEVERSKHVFDNIKAQFYFCHIISHWERRYHDEGVLTVLGHVSMKQVQYYIWGYGFTAVSFGYRYLKAFIADISTLYKQSLH